MTAETRSGSGVGSDALFANWFVERWVNHPSRIPELKGAPRYVRIFEMIQEPLKATKERFASGSLQGDDDNAAVVWMLSAKTMKETTICSENHGTFLDSQAHDFCIRCSLNTQKCENRKLCGPTPQGQAGQPSENSRRVENSCNGLVCRDLQIGHVGRELEGRGNLFLCQTIVVRDHFL